MIPTDQIPLGLGGPIVRRVDARQASVWVALRESATVELSLHERTDEVIAQSTRRTVKVAPRLHVAVVSAEATLEAGKKYLYSLRFKTAAGWCGLGDDGVLASGDDAAGRLLPCPGGGAKQHLHGQRVRAGGESLPGSRLGGEQRVRPQSAPRGRQRRGLPRRRRQHLRGLGGGHHPPVHPDRSHRVQRLRGQRRGRASSLGQDGNLTAEQAFTSPSTDDFRPTPALIAALAACLGDIGPAGAWSGASPARSAAF